MAKHADFERRVIGLTRAEVRQLLGEPSSFAPRGCDIDRASGYRYQIDMFAGVDVDFERGRAAKVYIAD